MPIVLLSFAVGEVHPLYIVDLANYASSKVCHMCGGKVGLVVHPDISRNIGILLIRYQS